MDIVVRRTRHVAHPRPVVFAFVTSSDAVGKTFLGAGPIPRALRSFSTDGQPLREGSVRVVENADGTVVEEVILTLRAPERQAYRLVVLPPAFARLVDGPRGDWRFVDEGAGTRVTWTFTFPTRSAFAVPVVWVLARFFGKAMQRCLDETARLLDASSSSA